MKLILAANTMEHPGFPAFLHDASLDHPDAAFVVCGDLLNVFPEPGEDAEGSIFYELFGDMLPPELERLRSTHFRDVGHSSLIEPLRRTFGIGGDVYGRALQIATDRYERVFSAVAAGLGENRLFYVPGNMDYPKISALYAAGYANLQQLDAEEVSVHGLRIAGVGGIPRSCHPFADFTAISPYELSDDEYEKHLHATWGADVLITHLSPGECPSLEDYVRNSPVRAVICRAPFALDEAGSCRGVSQCEFLAGKMVIKVRPFDFPENSAFVVDLTPEADVDPQLDIYAWRAPREKAAQMSACLLA